MLGGLLWGWRQFFIAHARFVPAPGGILTESLVGHLSNLNPLASRTSLLDRDLHQLLFEGLLRYNPVTGQIEDALADFHISEDGKTYTLTLKKTAFFQNGDRVTVDDVLFTFETVIQDQNFENTVLRDGFEYISFDIVDERTLDFRLPERNVFFPSLLTTPILPKKAFKEALIEEITDPDYPFNKHPIGAGPFRLRNIVPNKDGSVRVFLVRNEHYYGGAPYIDQMVFYVYPSFAHMKVAPTWTTLYSHIPWLEMGDFEEQFYGSYERREYILPRFLGLFFQLDRPMMGKYKALRQALSLSIDKDKLLDKERGWNRLDSFFFFEGVESWHVTDEIKARSTLKFGGLPYNYNLEKRTEGIKGDPVQLKFVTSTAPPVYSRIAQSLVRTWEESLDIEIELEILDPPEFQDVLKTRDYDLVLFGQNFSQNFDSLSTWHSSHSKGLNLSNLTNGEVDFLISEVRFSGGQTDLFALNEKLEEIVPGVVLATSENSLLVSRELKGFTSTFGKVRSHAERFFGVEKWHFYTQRDWDWPNNKNKFVGFFRWILEKE